MGLPVLPAFSLCTCCRHYPGAASECMSLLTSPDVSAFPDRVVGSACAMSFSRLARRSLTLRPAHSPSHLVTFYIEGFSHFVTSMTAPIASGWSKSCRVGLSPTGKRRLSTAHADCCRSRQAGLDPTQPIHSDIYMSGEGLILVFRNLPFGVIPVRLSCMKCRLYGLENLALKLNY